MPRPALKLPYGKSLMIIMTNTPLSGKASQTTGLIMAIYNIGSIPAVFCTGPVNDLFGRRWGMFTGAVVIIIGTCIQATAKAVPQLLGGRFLLGFGVSFCCVSAPCFVSEVSPFPLCPQFYVLKEIIACSPKMARNFDWLL